MAASLSSPSAAYRISTTCWDSNDPGTTKNTEGRVIHLTTELQTLLEAQRAITDQYQRENGKICPWVFHRNGQRIESFRKAWKSACKLAGCPGRIPHDLRRTAVRNLVRAGVPERVSMQLTGHKTRSVFERYNIVSEPDLIEAARKLDIATAIATPGHSGQPSGTADQGNLAQIPGL
ncbi:MAG: hypothetical protein EHM71_00105 [Zetaproteobacteria bacterium]|nr:MAG: hypothetical protein EHM71_00105 [Zetaproteobacteria bacterium]